MPWKKNQIKPWMDRWMKLVPPLRYPDASFRWMKLLTLKNWLSNN
uniref:Uncharacterized protein n=1 Tax=Arundo donax TaxID=35708 RepID=A0A0A9GWS7_ARUDO